MRRTFVGLLVVLGIMLGAGAAGTPVNGDESVAAVTAGINLSTASHTIVRPVSLPTELSRAVVELARMIGILLASIIVVSFTSHLDRDRSVLRGERRVTRGPPAPSFA